MKPFERSALSILFSMVPDAVLYGLSGVDVIIPYYHMVGDSEVPHTRHLYPHKGVKQFEEDLEYLLSRYEPVGLPDLLNRPGPGKGRRKKSFLLTFDDGFREMHDVVAPILYRRGVPATFFLSTAFIDNRDMCHHNKASLLIEEWTASKSESLAKEVLRCIGADPGDGTTLAEKLLAIPYGERHLVDKALEAAGIDFEGYMRNRRPYLDTPQVEALIRDGFHIGSHSIDHPLYAEIPLEEQVRQTRQSTRELREKFGLPYGAFAFPHSDRGVGKAFFEEVYGNGTVDISFGTGGLKNAPGGRHLQRFSMEKPLQGARRILGYQYARAIFRNPM